MFFWIKLFLFFQFLIWIQIKSPVSVLIFPFSFDLILLSVVFVGLCFGIRRGLFAGLIGGFLIDSLSVSPLGFHILGYSLVGVLSGRWQGFYYMQSLKMNLFVVIVMTFLLFVEQLIAQYLFFSVSVWGAFVDRFLFQLIWNVVWAPVVFICMRGLKLVVNPYTHVKTSYEEFVTHP